jgi:hypothetical protein
MEHCKPKAVSRKLDPLLVAGFSLRDLPAALENATSSWLP